MGKLERRLIKFKKTHPYNVFNNRMRSLKRRWIYVNWYGIFFWRLLNEISMWSYEIRITCYDLLSNYTKGHRHAYIVYMLHIVAQSLSHVPLFATLWTAVHQASLSFTNSLNLLKLISMESVMSSNHLILCHSLLLFSSIFPSIRLFSHESAFPIRWPKYWRLSFSISSKASVLWHSAFFIVQPSHPYMTSGKTIVLTIQTFAGKVMPAF